MFGYLTILSVFAIASTAVVMFLLFRKKDFREIGKYCVIGSLVAFIDIIIEYLGTSTGHWTYNESIYFIFNLIPIELIFLFFSGGIMIRFIFLNISKIKIPVKANAIFYILILITFLMYVRELYQDPTASLLPLAIIIGLWGVSNISNENKDASLILAILAVIADLMFEIILISSGSYSYKGGFSFSIPMIYGLFTLGVLAVMEKTHKLDEFLDSVFVKNLLKLFGVYREKYTQKIVEAKEKIKYNFFK
jgi:hypothetical protein